MKLLDRLATLFRWVAGAIVPMIVRPVAPVALAWFVHVVLVCGMLVGLFYLEKEAGLREYIGRAPVEFQKFWLPALFLLLYLLAWAVRWWIVLLAPGKPTSDFPDIDQAWAEILEALDKAGIGIADTPLILVFGECSMGFDHLFRSLPHGLVVSGGSAPGSPIRVFANRDGIYLTLPGASLLGIQNWVSCAGEVAASDVYDSAYQSIGVGVSIGVDQSVGITVDGGVAASVGVGQPLAEIQRIIRRARDENRPLTDDEKRRIRELSVEQGPHPVTSAMPPSKEVGTVLQNERLRSKAIARLIHVLGLIATTRWPLCSINGAILAVPVEVSDRDDQARQWGLVASEDLATTEATLKQRFPVFALVGGIEQLAGGATFFERFALEKGAQRLGKGFPLNPDIRPDQYQTEVERSAHWPLANLLPYWAYKLMRVDGGSQDTRDNANLFRFLVELRRRAPRIAELVGRAVAVRDQQLPVFGGTYFTVALPSDPTEAKFAREFFRKVESAQAAVAWTPDAYAEDAGYWSATRHGYLALGLVASAILAFGSYVTYLRFFHER